MVEHVSNDWVMPAKRGFHTADIAVFLISLSVSIGIGVYHAFTGGKQRTTEEYLMADRRLRTLPAALSMLVSFVSAILVLGTPAEMYTRGTQLLLKTIGFCIACIVSNLLFVPLFYSLQVKSSFEYLERRFQSRLIRLMGTLPMIAGNIFYMGLVIYTPSTALEAATGLPLWGSVVACGVVGTFYTALGGMKAVIWTDVFQAFVIICGMFAIVVQGVLNIGGLKQIWEISEKGGRLETFNFNPDPTQRLNFWSLTLGGAVNTLSIFGTGQASIQRYCSLPSLTEAKRSMYLNIPGMLVINVLAGLVGLVVYAHYASVNCDPLRAGFINNSNQLLPYYVVDVLNIPGFPGIFLAVLFSGALSSVSSSLNAVATVTWEDIAKPFFSHLSEAGKANVTRMLVICYGAMGLMVSFLANRLGGHVLQASISFTGALAGPVLGMFLLGAIFPSANAKGAIVGFITSMLLSLWITVGAFIVRPYSATLPTSVSNCWRNNSSLYNTSIVAYTLSPPATPSSEHTLEGIERLYGLSFLWYGALSSGVTVVIGLIVSSFTEPDSEKVDPALIIPLADRLCCCLSSRWQHKLLWKQHQLIEKEEQEELQNIPDVGTPERSRFLQEGGEMSDKVQSSPGETSQDLKI